jgi:hypothetical protein
MAQSECTADVRESQEWQESPKAFEVSDPAGATLAGGDVDELTEAERERLARLRRAVERGERGEYFPVNKRQDFVRWLVSQGKLSEN